MLRTVSRSIRGFIYGILLHVRFIYFSRCVFCICAMLLVQISLPHNRDMQVHDSPPSVPAAEPQGQILWPRMSELMSIQPRQSVLAR